jgi:TolB-like protein
LVSLPQLEKSLLIACALLISPLAAARAQCPDGTPPPCAGSRAAVRARVVVPTAAERSRRFLLLPFRNVTRQAEQDWLVEGSTTMLADALGRWQGITVVPDERLYPALRRAGITPGAVMELPRIRRVAEETGGWTAVTGDIIATGGRVRITARAFDVPTNRELVRADGDVAPGGDVRATYDSVSLRLLRLAGLDSAASDLAGATTHDLDAYRAYLSGVAHQRRGEVRPALADYNEAVRRDSGFALAWARLAEMVPASDPASMFNPASPGARASARAVALASRLPIRQRQLVQAIDASFRMQFAECRNLLAGLLAADSNDVDALEQLVQLEMFDPVLVGPTGAQRPRGSLNRAAILAKRVIELDPSRHTVYAMLVQVHAQAGIPGSTPVFGVDRAPSSLQDLLQTLQHREHLRIYTPVLRDTIVLVPAESVAAIPKDSLTAMRRAARRIARSWAERWVAVAPGEAAAHQITAELLMYDAEYPAALRELAVAESLGIQSPQYVPAARRLLFTAKSGALAQAGRLADSLSTAGFFADPSHMMVNRDVAMWAFMLHLLAGHTAQAAGLLENNTQLMRLVQPGMPGLPLGSLFVMMGNSDPDEEPGITRAVRAQVLDSTVRHVNELAASEVLGPYVPMLLPALAEAAGHPETHTGAVLQAAESLAASGRTRLAFELASDMVEEEDSTAEVRAAAFPWYRSGAEALNAVRSAMSSHMHAGSASVGADRAVFEFRVDSLAPLAWNRPETPAGQGQAAWDVKIVTGARYYRLRVNALRKVPGAPADSGSLEALLPPTATRIVLGGTVGADGVEMDTSALQSVQLKTEMPPGFLRLVITDRAVLDVLRRERPAQARFRFTPCVRPPGQNRQCLDERVTIAYP